MNHYSRYLQALIFGFFIANGFEIQAQENRDVTKLSIQELKSYPEVRAHSQNRMREYSKRYRAAKPEDKAAVARTIPRSTPYNPLLSKLIAEGTDTQADEILTWWWHGARGKRDGQLMTQLLIDHHSQSKIIEKYAPRIPWALKPDQAESALRQLRKNATLKSIKATCTYSLLQLLQHRLDTTEIKDAEKLNAEIATLSKLLETDYAEMTDLAGVTFADRIAGAKFVDQLAIGKPVPDIVGSDLDGVDFKLSDYQGKVIMISFWGYW